MFHASFVESLNSAIGNTLSHTVLEALQGNASVSIRINQHKSHLFNLDNLERVPWCPDGYYLPQRPLFSADPFLHLGHYYVQEASSMIVGELVKALLPATENGSLVLDLCAAPGGKSTHIASVLNPSDVLVSNEVISSRTPILEENLAKWGVANHIVTRADSEFWGRSGLSFDVVVADLPCSGEGMFRKDPEALQQWSLGNVELCAQRQRRIVSEVWKAIKPGGFLIYSTCTFNRKENEDNLLMLKDLPGFTPVSVKSSGLSFLLETEPHMFRALPGMVKGEGFFVSVIQKQTTEYHNAEKGKIKSFQTITNQGLWPSGIQAFQLGDEVFATRCHGDLFFSTLAQLPGYHSPGVCIGKSIRGVFKPNPRLALMCGIENSGWVCVNLSDTEVMSYLRRETLQNTDLKTDTTLALWKNHPVGFLSPNRNRWNNLWPMEWRLRMEAREPESFLF